jgi:hypothetical protein
MVILRIGENDYIIEIYQIHLPFQSRQDDINGTLESCRGIPEAKWHPKESVSSLVAGEILHVRISRSERNFPKAAISVQSTEYTGIPERINTLVHTRKRLRISDGHRVELPVIDANCIVPSGLGTSTTGPIRAGSYDDTGFQHPGFFLTLNFPRTRSSSRRLRMYRLRSRIEVNPMFGSVNSTSPSIPQLTILSQ